MTKKGGPSPAKTRSGKARSVTLKPARSTSAQKKKKSAKGRKVSPTPRTANGKAKSNKSAKPTAKASPRPKPPPAKNVKRKRDAKNTSPSPPPKRPKIVGRKRKRDKPRKMTLGQHSDSDSSDSTSEIMDQIKRRRTMRMKDKMKPINMEDMGLYDQRMGPDIFRRKGKEKGKPSNADITPIEIKLDVDWNSVGGLQNHIAKLKEMVVLPMLYPEEFAHFKMNPPKGVLFHGPPGTGKTLVARVLAATCSKHGKKVSFYMRKGADCLSKWVGEAERQLRMLFEKATETQPSIIFFDEIDGLAPVRSSQQDQIHSSIVSTLLALMDGLDGRGQIIVIGATNRIDAIDPALRRPGRFDRELLFTLPSMSARQNILKIHTKSWEPKPQDAFLAKTAEKCVGYCGADLEALCREAFLCCVRRTFPQIYTSDEKLKIDVRRLRVSEIDFERAMDEIVPSSKRSSVVYARALPEPLVPLLGEQTAGIVAAARRMFPLDAVTHSNKQDHGASPASGDAGNAKGTARQKILPNRPRMLLSGSCMGSGQGHCGLALLHNLEEFPVYSIDLPTLYGDQTSRGPEECLLNKIKEARRNAPSIVYWPHIDMWWRNAPRSLQTTCLMLLEDIPADTAVFVVGVSDKAWKREGAMDVDEEDDLAWRKELVGFFSRNDYSVRSPSGKQRERFWKQLRTELQKPPIVNVPPAKVEKLKPVKSKRAQKMNAQRIETEQHDLTMVKAQQSVTAMRTYIRGTCSRLVKNFKDFLKPLDVPNCVRCDISLLHIRSRNNSRLWDPIKNAAGELPTPEAFLDDIDSLVGQVKSSTQPFIDESLKAREYLNEACHLQDAALTRLLQVQRDLVQDIKRIESDVKAGVYAKKRPAKRKRPKKDQEDEKRDATSESDEESSEQSAMTSPETSASASPEPQQPKVKVNLPAIDRAIKKIERHTAKWELDDLERAYVHCIRIVCDHSDKYDRSGAVKLLDQAVKDLPRPRYTPLS